MAAVAWWLVTGLVLLVVGLTCPLARRSGFRRWRKKAPPVIRLRSDDVVSAACQQARVAVATQALTLAQQFAVQTARAVERRPDVEASYRVIVDRYVNECSEIIRRGWS